MRKRLALAFLMVVLLTGMVMAQPGPTYVVATHYPELGGTEPAPRREIKATYTVYNNRETDYFAVDEATAQAVLARIEEQAGIDAVMLNDWADVQEGSDSLQIINNIPIEGALYTVFLPPGWKRDASLPVILSGNGARISNNKRFFDDAEITLPVLIATSTQAGGKGLIGAMSNAGGTESQGIDDVTYRSVGAFFDWIDQNGGDKMNAVTAGGSRGGGSALMWAINPLELDYHVHTVFAEVPPTHYGTLSQVSTLTYPSMAGIGTLVSGDDNAWRFDHDGLHPGMNPSPFMETLIGTGIPAEADALSPIGLAEKLVGKQVVISAGAHDAFFPLSPFLAFDRRLTELGVHHATFVTLASGHEMNNFWMQTLFVYLQGLSRGIQLPLLTGRYYFIDADPIRDDELSLKDFFTERDIQANPRLLPVIAQFPYKAGVGNPIDVEVCGAPGTEIVLMASNAAAMYYYYQGILDETECHTEKTVIEGPPGHAYEWTLIVNGETINPRNTPTRDGQGCGFPAVTIIEAEQPRPEDTYAFNRDMSFGLDQYSGQPDSCS